MKATQLYGQCMTCGARMLIAAISEGGVPVDKLAPMLRRAGCPHCGEGAKRIGMCPTDGPDAVTEPRGPVPKEEAPSLFGDDGRGDKPKARWS